MPTAKTLDAVHRTSDGRLQAHSYSAGTCSNLRCDGFHFDLLDERGDIFATMVIGAEELPELMLAFTEFLEERYRAKKAVN